MHLFCGWYCTNFAHGAVYSVVCGEIKTIGKELRKMTDIVNEKKPPMRRLNARMLTESALLVALATVLHLYAVFKMQNGGSITIGSMIPIMLVSFKYRFSWSLTVAFVYSLIQMMTGFYAPPVENLGYYSLMILLDYVLAYGVLCLSGPIYRILNQNIASRVRLTVAALTCIALRFLCHFFSGMIIWGTFAPEGQPVWLYSLLYNGSYMLGEALVSGAIMFLVGQKLTELFIEKRRQ